MRSTLGRILVALLIAAGVVVIPASSAYACRCAPATPQAQLLHSEAVFAGRLINVQTRSNEGHVQSRWYERVLTFQVGRVYKGAVASVEEVASQAGEASCGLDLQGDGPFLVFADATGAPPGQPRYFSNSCTGTHPVSDTQPVPEGLGRASPPVDQSSQPVTEPAVAIGATASTEGTDASSISPALTATLLALFAAVLAMLWHGRNRNRTTPPGV